jgi:6,7-dimethyl-8-ribityllumazine synthase
MSHLLIVEARFYTHIADMLVEGASACLTDHGATFERIAIPGAFEIPAAIAMAATSGKYDGFIALGCVIRGETTHYDYVCAESARGLNELAITQHLAIGYGILTTENEAQALVRADPGHKNKGRDAALAALRMIELKHHFKSI